MVSTARMVARKVKDMKDREEYFCRAAARQSLFCDAVPLYAVPPL